MNNSWIFALECLIQLVNYKDQYKNVFRDVGLLEVLTNCLVHYSVALNYISETEGRDLQFFYSIVGYRQSQMRMNVQESQLSQGFPYICCSSCFQTKRNI